MLGTRADSPDVRAANCDDGIAICPRHGANIDIRSGRALTLPAVDTVATYAVRVVDGMVKVDVG